MTAEPPPYGGESGPRQRVPKKMTVTRVAAARTRYLIGAGTKRINDASRAGGADESGLSRLIWTHAAHYTADAMIAVCLAGTIFFSAARSEQRTQVALYLLVTMAPFAVVAPFIGPALDRLQRGRRMALAATALGRGVLAWVMAAQFHNGFALYPAAFGALVLSKAYAVLRGACLPRVLPPGMSLVSANARMSMFGLGAAAVGAGALAGVINVSDSYPLALRITAVCCVGAAVLSLRLPAAVDSSAGEEPVSLTATGPIPRSGGLSLGPHVVTALRAGASLRALSGFLTLFLAFWIQSTETGTAAALALGGLVAAASGGAVAGTALGARMPLKHPDPVLLGAIGGVAGIAVLAALSFGLGTALLVVAGAGVANALGKLCLDAIIQREVPDQLRASAFARSETLLQLAWVLGGGLGIALPSNGTLGFAVAAGLLVVAFALTLAGRRRPLLRRRPDKRPRPA
ncbi:MAG TPA: MFS transporter [Mycobacteriales bacterium]|nr:MFS transporter [Mycobacteriales bacterium]